MDSLAPTMVMRDIPRRWVLLLAAISVTALVILALSIVFVVQDTPSEPRNRLLPESPLGRDLTTHPTQPVEDIATATSVETSGMRVSGLRRFIASAAFKWTIVALAFLALLGGMALAFWKFGPSVIVKKPDDPEQPQPSPEPQPQPQPSPPQRTMWSGLRDYLVGSVTGSIAWTAIGFTCILLCLLILVSQIRSGKTIFGLGTDAIVIAFLGYAVGILLKHGLDLPPAATWSAALGTPVMASLLAVLALRLTNQPYLLQNLPSIIGACAGGVILSAILFAIPNWVGSLAVLGLLLIYVVSRNPTSSEGGQHTVIHTPPPNHVDEHFF